MPLMNENNENEELSSKLQETKTKRSVLCLIFYQSCCQAILTEQLIYHWYINGQIHSKLLGKHHSSIITNQVPHMETV